MDFSLKCQSYAEVELPARRDCRVFGRRRSSCSFSFSLCLCLNINVYIHIYILHMYTVDNFTVRGIGAVAGTKCVHAFLASIW